MHGASRPSSVLRALLVSQGAPFGEYPFTQELWPDCRRWDNGIGKVFRTCRKPCICTNCSYWDFILHDACCKAFIFWPFNFFVRIFQIPKLGTKLKQDAIPLSYTPRKFISHPTNQYFYLIEGDHRVMAEAAAANRLNDMVRLSFQCVWLITHSVIYSSGRQGNVSTRKLSIWLPKCLVVQRHLLERGHPEFE